MRARYRICALLILVACSGKKRPFADGPIEGLGGSGGSSPGTSAADENDASAGSGVEPTATEGQPPVDMLVPRDDTNQSSETLACEADAGACTTPDAGPPPPPCVPTGPRDCTSDVDNDCDGQPDNTLDDVCQCVGGTSELCNEHPGFDGQGQCRAGLRTCLLDEGTLATAWSECEGAVGPSGQDSCAPGDDADCDGTPNEGCSCVDGETQPCGSSTNTGPCQIGTSTCVEGRFGPCVGAVAPASADSCSSRNDDSDCNGIPFDGCSCVNGEMQPCGMTDTGVCALGTRTCVNGRFGQCIGAVDPRSRNCGSAQDNDCDGSPDNTIDDVCQCVPGQGNGPCSGDANNSRCGAAGRCEPCRDNADCTLVSGGRTSCDAGRCVQPLLGLGATCGDDAECASSFCATWYRDLDDDEQGDPLQQRRTCTNRQAPVAPSGFVGNSTDCCDATLAVAGQIFRGQTSFFDEPQTACPTLDPYDYDCSGTLTDQFEGRTNTNGGCGAACEGTVWLNAPPATCGDAGPTVICGFVVVGTTVSCEVRFVGGAPEQIVKACR